MTAMHPRKSIPLVIALGLIIALLAAPATAGNLLPGVNLFFVERSLNANEVHYDAVVDTENCNWQSPYVDYYWRNLANGDND